ncbi:putative ferredoxin [Gemella bergeri ATCC 700627]|uniref:Ferredoxin n=1 Tax=Gemella bergeri ATCC 700627 TaxID=1321820 RepID=U2QTM6_9BACL|nr:ferredoxin [Gemella bergeri]ERK59564.1 putative ferredoxin [Gemella bergeri ATCC 700627]
MKTKINREDCIACGNCSAICPDVYDYDEDGIAFCHIDNNSMSAIIPEKYESLIKEACENCPTESVIVEENKEGEQIEY